MSFIIIVAGYTYTVSNSRDDKDLIDRPLLEYSFKVFKLKVNSCSCNQSKQNVTRVITERNRQTDGRAQSVQLYMVV